MPTIASSRGGSSRASRRTWVVTSVTSDVTRGTTRRGRHLTEDACRTTTDTVHDRGETGKPASPGRAMRHPRSWRPASSRSSTGISGPPCGPESWCSGSGPRRRSSSRRSGFSRPWLAPFSNVQPVAPTAARRRAKRAQRATVGSVVTTARPSRRAPVQTARPAQRARRALRPRRHRGSPHRRRVCRPVSPSWICPVVATTRRSRRVLLRRVHPAQRARRAFMPPRHKGSPHRHRICRTAIPSSVCSAGTTSRRSRHTQARRLPLLRAP